MKKQPGQSDAFLFTYTSHAHIIWSDKKKHYFVYYCYKDESRYLPISGFERAMCFFKV